VAIAPTVRTDHGVKEEEEEEEGICTISANKASFSAVSDI